MAALKREIFMERRQITFPISSDIDENIFLTFQKNWSSLFKKIRDSTKIWKALQFLSTIIFRRISDYGMQIRVTWICATWIRGMWIRGAYLWKMDSWSVDSWNMDLRNEDSWNVDLWSVDS